MQEELKLIYKLLKDKEYHTATEMSEILSVSTKTCRKYIKELKEVLEAKEIELYSKRSMGYKLKGKILNEDQIFKYDKEIIDTSKKRIKYLIYELIEKDDYIKIENLSKKLYVSPKTISLNLKKVEEEISKYNLKLDRKPYYGIKILGQECDIRNLLVELLETSLYENNMNEIIKEFLKKNNSKNLYRYFSNRNIKISDLSFQNLLISIFVTIKRFEKNKKINNLNIKIDDLFLEKKDIILDFLSKNFKDIKLDEDDVEYITIRFLIAETLNYSNLSTDIEEIDEIILEILKYMNLTFQIDLFDNKELYKNLYTHLIALVIRITFDIPIANPLLDDIIKNMDFEYKIALYLAKIIENKYNKKISSEEIAYLAIILHMGIETNKKEVKGKNILIVCPSGRGISKFLIYTYNNLFSKYINKVSSCGSNELLDMNLKDIDIIFTLIDLDVKINKPVYKINYFLNEEETQKIKRILKDDKENFKEIIPQNLYFYINEKKTKEEIIKLMSDEIQKVTKINDNIYDLIQEREKLGLTEISSNIAIPHSIKVVENVNIIGVVVSKYKVKWQKNNVNIMLFLFLDNKNNNNEFIYKSIIKLADDKEAIEEIISCKNYNKFITIIKEKTDEL